MNDTTRNPPAPKLAKPAPSKVRIVSPHDTHTIGLKVIYWGQTGRGKTHSCCTWPFPLWLHFDPHASTIRKWAWEPGPILYPTLAEMESVIRPALRDHRMADLLVGTRWEGYPVRTVVLDSWTFYGVRVLRDLERKFDTYDLWAEYLRRMTNLALDLSESTQPHPTDPSRPVYHHVATVHEDPDQKRVGTGKEQELVTVNMAPALQGKARKLLFSQYDAVLNLTKETKPVRDEDNKMVRQDRWWAWSVSPDELHQDCKDSIGGGRFNPLPYRVPNGDFVSLATAWGLPDELIQEARDTASWKPRDVNNNTNTNNTKENHSA